MVLRACAFTDAHGLTFLNPNVHQCVDLKKEALNLLSVKEFIAPRSFLEPESSLAVALCGKPAN
jgi:hypothetical protein